jgi:hypothetical protein
MEYVRLPDQAWRLNEQLLAVLVFWSTEYFRRAYAAAKFLNISALNFHCWRNEKIQGRGAAPHTREWKRGDHFVVMAGPCPLP